MALQDVWTAFVAIGDSRKKISVMEFRVSAADAILYLEATPGVARAATDVGILLANAAELSAGNVIDQGVRLVQQDDSAGFPAPSLEVYNFDKFSVSYKAGFNNYTMTIPARDMSDVTVESDGVTVSLTGSAEVAAFIVAFEATALAANGSSPDVQKIQVTR